jgi:hypothetical protein
VRSHPKKPKAALPAFPFFSPYLLHDLIGNISRGLWPRDRRRPFLQRRRQNATRDQSLLLLGVALQTAGNDPCHGFVAVTHQHLFAVPDELNMGPEPSLEIADIHCSHTSFIADMTMLVIFDSGV